MAPPFFAMPGSFNLISEEHQEISDSELAGLDDGDSHHASYADATARGIPSDDRRNDDHNDDGNGDHNDADQAEYDARHRDAEECHPRVQRAHLGQHRTLSDFEREHFHPLNVTPDRPCTAFFKPPGEYSSKHIFDSLLRTGIAANAVSCMH